MHRKILLASVAVGCLGCAATASAASMGHFAGLNAGGDIGWAHVMGQIDDVNPNYANNSGFQDVKSADGLLLGGHLGYDWQFDRWVAGLEAGAQSIMAGSAGCGAAGCSNGGEGGNPNLFYDMNGIATFKARVGYIVMPDTLLYASGGFAVAEVQTHHHDNEEYDGTTRYFSGYTLGAGVQHALSQHVDVRLDFAWDQFSSKHWTDFADETFGAKPEAITLALGAVWHFNAPASEAPLPPPPPSPPRMTPSEFVIFFGFNKCNITAEADRVLGEAAAASKERGSASVEIVGHTDTVGSPRYNQRLSECRANAAEKNLEGKGVPAGAISTSGVGETDLLIQTGDGVKEPQNRRDTITLH